MPRKIKKVKLPKDFRLAQANTPSIHIAVPNSLVLKKKPPKGSVVLMPETITDELVIENKEMIYDSNNWHKFTMFNTGTLSRQIVLNSIMKFVHPADLIPLNFTRTHANCFFLSRNCGAAVERLCEAQLTVPHVNNSNYNFKVQIIIKFTDVQSFTIDLEKHIKDVLLTRYDGENKKLVLNSFHGTEDLVEYSPLYQPKIFYFVLHLAKKLEFQHLDLKDNELSIIEPLQIIANDNILSIDLSNNSIKNATFLKVLLKFQNLREVTLQNNPFCQFFDENTYLQLIKDCCPKLEVLDGFKLKENGCFLIQKYFFVSPKGVDLVDQFMEYYFTNYDSNSRLSLQDLYHNEATFTFTCFYYPLKLSDYAQINGYNQLSRNIKMLEKPNLKMFYGSQSIVEVLQKLPPSEHDRKTFQIDLISYTGSGAVIVVNGIFREPKHKYRVYAFTRNFVLLSENGEYSIVNEQFHLHNAEESAIKESFLNWHCGCKDLPYPATDKQKTFLAATYQSLTNERRDLSMQTLQQNNYNLKDCLSKFIEANNEHR